MKRALYSSTACAYTRLSCYGWLDAPICLSKSWSCYVCSLVKQRTLVRNEGTGKTFYLHEKDV